MLGSVPAAMPNFEYFLSCGIPGKLEGERYKKTPELVTQWTKEAPQLQAPARFIIFKRWDRLEPSDEPEVIISSPIPTFCRDCLHWPILTSPIRMACSPRSGLAAPRPYNIPIWKGSPTLPERFWAFSMYQPGPS